MTCWHERRIWHCESLKLPGNSFSCPLSSGSIDADILSLISIAFNALLRLKVIEQEREVMVYNKSRIYLKEIAATPSPQLDEIINILSCTISCHFCPVLHFNCILIVFTSLWQFHSQTIHNFAQRVWREHFSLRSLFINAAIVSTANILGSWQQSEALKRNFRVVKWSCLASGENL